MTRVNGPEMTHNEPVVACYPAAIKFSIMIDKFEVDASRKLLT
jgi:hypothetical protein